MSIKVANLANLFWDNGTYKYPNTYPKLFDGKEVNKTPVMTSPTSGWVILEGDWNYCEFRGELFFLKKSYVISHTRDKWMYVLIKDHICNIFKKKAGVKASGTLINTDIDNLSDTDIQYTFPVFSNYNKRILIPLTTGEFNWRTRANIREIDKVFDYYYPISDEDYSNFVAVLEANRDMFTHSPDRSWSEVVKTNEYLVLLGVLGYDYLDKGTEKRKVKGWKNELVEKINTFLREIPARSDCVMGVISNATITNATKINGRYAISYTKNNPLFTVVEENKVVDIDLSGLTDIELINFDNPVRGEKYALDHFNLFLKYNVSKVSAGLRDTGFSFVHKLSRRVRLSFFNKYSTRAIVRTGGRYLPFVWTPPRDVSFCYPQKIFFKNPEALPLKWENSKIARAYSDRKQGAESYRSVYLYWVFNWDFLFAWGDGLRRDKIWHYPPQIPTWIDNKEYFSDPEKQDLLRGASGPEFLHGSGYDSILIFPCPYEYRDVNSDRIISAVARADYYKNAFPWNNREIDTLNIGWLVGQFSEYIKGQENYFETKFPFVVKIGVQKSKKLKRIKGLKHTVSGLVHFDDWFDIKGRSNVFTLDCFNWLSRRMQEFVSEEDFLIGEKLLFTTWGMAPYLLFQPAFWTHAGGGTVWGLQSQNAWVYALRKDPVAFWTYYQYPDIDNYTYNQTFFKWIDVASYHYSQVVFDSGSYFKEHAQQSYKKAYDDYRPLTPYKRFYSSGDNYKELKKHIIANTESYFETEEVDFSTNLIKELKVGDIFYSDEEWYWFDAGGGNKLGAPIGGEFLQHRRTLITDRSRLAQGDIVAYINPKDNKIYIGEVYTYVDKVKLPAGQYIATGPSIESSSSDQDYLNVRYTRITPNTDRVSENSISYESIDVLISSLKQQRFLKQTRPTSLQELQDQGRSYLFNLKGTPFFCLLDRLGRVSLIFKNKLKYEESEHIPN